MALFLILAVVLVGMLALTVDVGLIHTARREAQVAADSAALAAAAYVPTSTTEATAAAIEFAGYNKIDGTPITSSCVEVQFGTWSPSLGVFTPAATPGNSVRVTIRRDATHAGPVPLTFGRILNQTGFNVSRSAIAMTTPRDIIFVVDMSPSMNNDTEPCWATTIINNAFNTSSPPIGTQLVQKMYSEMGWQTTFPGGQQYLGFPLLTLSQNDGWNYAVLTDNDGPLTKATINTAYRILNTDSEPVRKDKAYRYIIDEQISKFFPPNVKPDPKVKDTATRKYWSYYLDYLATPQLVRSNTKGGLRFKGTTKSAKLPEVELLYNVANSTYGNPFHLLQTAASTAEVNSHLNMISLRTYLQFMLDFGKDEVLQSSGVYTPLSTNHPFFLKTNENVDGEDYVTPLSEQPMQAIRRALISTINLIKTRNANVGDSNQLDRIAVLAMDSKTRTAADVVLTSDYNSVRNSCAMLQSSKEQVTASTATQLDANLVFAGQQLLPTAQGRPFARKIVVILSDFYPTNSSYTQAQIDAYQLQYPYPDYGWFHAIAPPPGVTDSRYEPNSTRRTNLNGALMAAHQRYATGVEIYGVKVGFSSSQTMADALAEFGGTANTANEAPIVTNNPALYEDRIKAVLADIIDNPRGRLVQ